LSLPVFVVFLDADLAHQKHARKIHIVRQMTTTIIATIVKYLQMRQTGQNTISSRLLADRIRKIRIRII